MHSADKKYKLINERTYTWSPKLANVSGCVRYWKTRKQIAQGLIPPTNLDWRLKKFDIKDLGSNELEYINDELKTVGFTFISSRLKQIHCAKHI